jgi:hypothetical protein
MRALISSVIAASVAMTMTACVVHLPEGTVAERHRKEPTSTLVHERNGDTHEKVTKQDWILILERKDGSRMPIHVPEQVWIDCFPGEHVPECAS